MTARWLLALRLSGYGGVYFFAAGAFVSYWPEWLRDRGVGDVGIGTLFMIRQLALVPATFAVGWVAHKAGNLRAVQRLLRQTKLESTVRYLGVDIEDALTLAEGTKFSC